MSFIYWCWNCCLLNKTNKLWLEHNYIICNSLQLNSELFEWFTFKINIHLIKYFMPSFVVVDCTTSSQDRRKVWKNPNNSNLMGINPLARIGLTDLSHLLPPPFPTALQVQAHCYACVGIQDIRASENRSDGCSLCSLPVRLGPYWHTYRVTSIWYFFM